MTLAATSERRWEIDALRGLMLVLMTLTHLPSRLTDPLGQPLGYVSAAEGFVLLSAYMAGLVYGRQAVRSGIPAMRRAFWRRALLIYACHAALLVFLFTVIAFLGLKVDQPAIKNLMAFYLREPLAGLLGGLMLIHQPPLLDILPLYVLFMLGSPWVLAIALRHGWAPVLAFSALLWIGAQLGLARSLYHGAAAIVALPVPYEETGAFNSFAWQLLWILGLWLGARRNDAAARPLVFPAGVLALAAATALVALAWRHTQGQAPFGANIALNLWFDKWQLAPLRMLNLAALTVLAMHFGSALAARLPRMPVLETLGAASLPAFCAHLVIVLLVLSLFGADFGRPWPVDAVLVLGSLGCLYSTARLALRLEQRPRAQPAALRAPWSGPRPGG